MTEQEEIKLLRETDKIYDKIQKLIDLTDYTDEGIDFRKNLIRSQAWLSQCHLEPLKR